MSIAGLNHVTIRCLAEDLPALLEFYTRSVGLVPGARPALRHPGYWLYAAGQPIVHLYASLSRREPGAAGAVDHVSFSARDLDAVRARLRAEGTRFDEAPIPGTSIHQLFLRDPIGVKLELTFDLELETDGETLTAAARDR